MNVFICDDSILIRERLAEQLTQVTGITSCEQAETVSDSISKIKKTHPDIAIVDLRLPDGSGMEVLEFIKKKIPSIIVLVLTNYPNSQYKKKCLRLGADYFLDKSSEFERVAEICSELINNHLKSSNRKQSTEIHTPII